MKNKSSGIKSGEIKRKRGKKKGRERNRKGEGAKSENARLYSRVISVSVHEGRRGIRLKRSKGQQEEGKGRVGQIHESRVPIVKTSS